MLQPRKIRRTGKNKFKCNHNTYYSSYLMDWKIFFDKKWLALIFAIMFMGYIDASQEIGNHFS